MMLQKNTRLLLRGSLELGDPGPGPLDKRALCGSYTSFHRS